MSQFINSKNDQLKINKTKDEFDFINAMQMKKKMVNKKLLAKKLPKNQNAIEDFYNMVDKINDTLNNKQSVVCKLLDF